MAVNPMQRKARTSFLLGMVITLLITGAIIAWLLMQLMEIKKKEKEEAALMVEVAILNKDVESGKEIDASYFDTVSVLSTTAPKDFITPADLGEKNTARIAMTAGTIVGEEMINIDEEEIAKDLRRQEYNMIVLPIDLVTGDYVDIRLMLPTGEDYIVLSKKIVEVANINGIDSDDTIYLELTEEETISLSSAIVEAYWINGSKLYVNKYIEPGMQEAATTTYPPKREVLELINANPNVIDEAKTALANRYNVTQREKLDNKINSAGEDAQTNTQTKMQESITNTKEDRKSYLEGI